MDTEVLNAIPDCKRVLDEAATRKAGGKKMYKACHWWREYMGKCIKPANIDCPKGVKPPQQEVAEMDYTILG